VISFTGAGRELEGYLALPEGPGPHPGLVVIHEAFGLNDGIRRIADRFAGAGYAALAVDLFANRNRALCMARFFSGFLRGSTHTYGIDDLRASLSHLQQRPEIDATRCGAVGFCMGGTFAILWACGDDRLRSIAPFYAMNPRPLEAARRLCPVVGSYPEKDFTAGAGRKLDKALDEYGVAHDIKVYPGAHHSFFNQDRGAYDAAASDDAWNRMLAFFSEHLK
jgi:carboxymethylenebutenolidase